MALANTLRIREFRIDTIITGDPWKENCYLLGHVSSGELALIDPGDDVNGIVAEIEKVGMTPSHILLTHAHHDHVGAVAAACRKFNLSCEIHKDDVRLLRQAAMYAWTFAHRKIETPSALRIFDAGHALSLGDQTVEIIHTPGHTPGSVCFSIGSAVFTGDTILNQHVGRTDLPGSDAAVLKASVNKLLELVRDDALLLPGHGRPWTGAEARAWWRGAAAAPPSLDRFED
jgi:glyoxylase-like metal-dependent hydrolase (beta-lactamase superfamily II)